MLVVQVRRQIGGFSMIEMAVVMSVIAIVGTISFSSFMSMIGNAQIRSVGESFRNGLQLARAEAVKRNQKVRFRINADNSWEVGCVDLIGDTDGDGLADCPTIIVKKAAREGSSGNIAVTRNGSDNVVFNSFGTQESTAGQLSEININNTSLSATEVRKIRLIVGNGSGSVRSGGSVRMCEPAITALTDPRKC